MSGTQRRLLATAAFLSLASASLAAQPPLPNGGDATVRQMLSRLEKNAEQFRRSLAETPDREWVVGGEQTRHIDHFVAGFVETVRRLRTEFGEGRIVTARVEEVLRRGVSIDSFMDRHQSADQAARDWATVRRDLESLATAYDIPWNRTPPRLTSLRPGVRVPRVVTSLAVRTGDGAACARA